MDLQILLIFLLCSLTLWVTGMQGVYGRSHSHGRHRKLFVFGDSYADTGNTPAYLSNSWKVPYGVMFPGKPSGRYSDGRVFTDYFAMHLGVRSPIPYRLRKYAGHKVMSAGMNFAYGGTGAFKTLLAGPNMTTQIQHFRKLVAESVFSAAGVNSSIALVTLAGNDYSYYQATDGSAKGLQTFIPRLVNQLALNLKSIKEMGVKKVVVGGLQPLGCLPSSTAALSFRSCNPANNAAAVLHNHLLKQAVAELNAKAKPLPPPFFILDLYSAFMSAIYDTKAHKGKFWNPLQPCCVGKSSNYTCGSADASGAKMYTLCEDRESAFFWDLVHPTQHGWSTVYASLLPTLYKIRHT